MSRTLLVVAHPRGDSLTAQVAERARLRAEAAGNSVDLLDLYAEGFDPRLTPRDEPDWLDREKRYSPEVHAHMRRIEEADDLVVVFPVWWFAPPAVVKGWIERVWNYGFAYGRSKPRLAGKRMLWLGLAGHAAEYYESTGLGTALELQLRVGISEFCGVGESAVRLLYGTEFSGIPETLRQERAREVFAAAEAVLAEFDGTEAPATAGTAIPVGI
ncbi:NAD(P)H oxidoreductase [Streptomyces sp. RerS4]|uniref:NAD(P)H oxidoreductase n=1 Tax=Streptomyces sp. RerS4 TaxID=2942449 RepID=UPI00201C0AAA|nr:NAD(P)H oxidoreductase [Streptomyces sp. RerS4]UQX05412.1 NAD(P)H oxidoreductase [Streptomyces sp. RerS4]